MVFQILSLSGAQLVLSSFVTVTKLSMTNTLKTPGLSNKAVAILSPSASFLLAKEIFPSSRITPLITNCKAFGFGVSLVRTTFNAFLRFGRAFGFGFGLFAVAFFSFNFSWMARISLIFTTIELSIFKV